MEFYLSKSLSLPDILIINLRTISSTSMNPVPEDNSSDEHHDSDDTSFLELELKKALEKYPSLKFEEAYHLEYCKLYVRNIGLMKQVHLTQI